MKKIRAILVSIVFILAACSAAFAEDISFKATVDSNHVTLGNSTHLLLKVTGAKKVDPIQLPAIEGIDSRYLGPQTEVSIVNGNYSSSKSFIYVLFSNKAGKFTVPAIAATIDGKDTSRTAATGIGRGLRIMKSLRQGWQRLKASIGRHGRNRLQAPPAKESRNQGA